MRTCGAVAVATVLAIMAAPRPALAGDPTVAREQLKIGYLLAQDGKCDEAIPHLEESLRLDPKAITLINLADCEEKVGKLAGAMTHWVDARARAQTEGAKQVEEEATLRATALEPRLPRLTIALAAAAPTDASVVRDGVVLGPPSLGIPLPLDPGPHTVVVKAKGRADGTTSVTLAEGETRSVEVDAGPAAVTSAPAPPGRPLSPLVFAGAGVAAVGIVVGTITGAIALGAGNDAENACPNLRCSQKAFDDVESGRTLGTVSTIAFALAAVGAAVAVYGFVVAKPPEPKAAALRFVGNGVGARF